MGDFDELEGHDPAAEDETVDSGKKKEPEPKADPEPAKPVSGGDKPK